MSTEIAVRRLCGTCGKVLPAKNLGECTPDRANQIVVVGFCVCPLAQGGTGSLDTLSPGVRAKFLELRRHLEDTDPSIPVAQIDTPPAGTAVVKSGDTMEGKVILPGDLPVLNAGDMPEITWGKAPLPPVPKTARNQHKKRSRSKRRSH